MPATITATYNGSYHSPGIDISLSGLSPYGSLLVERIDPSGEYPDTAVRGFEGVPVTGDLMVGTDYEAPLGRPFTYRFTGLLEVLANDTFGRTVSNGWGTATSGQTWTTSGGVAGDYSVAPSRGRHALGAVNSTRTTILDQTIEDFSLYAEVTLGSQSVANAPSFGLIGRYVDANNYYVCNPVVLADNTVALKMTRIIAGVGFSSAYLVVPGLTHSSGATYAVRFQMQGIYMYAKIWNVISPEPINWQVSNTNSAHTTGKVGCQSALTSGTFSTTINVDYSNFYARTVTAIPSIIETDEVEIPVDGPGEAVLKSVSQPALSRRVNVSEWNDITTAGKVLGEYTVLGRTNKVVITDGISGREGTVTLATYPFGGVYENDSHWGDLRILLERGGTLLLQTAGRYVTGEDDLYFEIKSVGRTRVGHVGGELVHLTEVSYIEVDRPSATDESLGLVSWQDILDNYTTWQDVLNSNSAWLDLLDS